MAQDKFLRRVDALFEMLGLQRQKGNVDDVHTITVDGYLAINVAGIRDTYVTFFTEVPVPEKQRNFDRFAEFLEFNLFPKAYPPFVLAYERKSSTLIHWWVEELDRLDDTELFKAFECYFAHVEQLWKEVDFPGTGDKKQLLGEAAAHKAPIEIKASKKNPHTPFV